MSKLVLFLADGEALDIRLDRERLTIGRRPDNDICLPYPAVSGEHAAVVTILADSFLEDQGSTNGTLVNGRPITKHFLRDRDQIDIGRQRLVYVVDETATIEAPHAPQLDAGSRLPGEKAGRSPRPMPVVHGIPVGQTGEAPPPAGPWPPPRPAEAVAPLAVAKPAAAGVAVPSLRVLSGASAGKTLPLTKDETLVGRVGRQVAALRRTPGGMLLVPVEGERAPVVNGLPVGAAGLPVHAGDVIEVAGARLEILAAGEAAPGAVVAG